MTKSELMTLLFERPGLYIGHGNVQRVEAFITGYGYAVKLDPDPVFDGFGQWLRKRFEVRQDLNWASIIEFIGKSEAGAFESARELWEIYQLERKEPNKNSDEWI